MRKLMGNRDQGRGMRIGSERMGNGKNKMNGNQRLEKENGLRYEQWTKDMIRQMWNRNEKRKREYQYKKNMVKGIGNRKKIKMNEKQKLEKRKW